MEPIYQHQAQKMYPGRATFEFHAGNSPTGFQADGFRVIVDGHVIAECEDSECADFICSKWNAARTLAKHKWSWCSAEFDTLPGLLEKLEDEGWEIVAIIRIGDKDRFCRVVYRRAELAP